MLHILLATHGDASAVGAVRLAERLARRGDVRVSVLSVFEPVLVYPPGPLVEASGYPPALVEPALHALEERVQAQLDEVGGLAAGWKLAMESGSVAPAIARYAAAVEADLVVVGLRTPGRVERWISREAVVRLLHLCGVPVLAVPPEVSELPTRAVAALDFSEHSLRAAREAAWVLAPDGELHLTHATWSPPAESGWTESLQWVETYRAGVQQRLKALAVELAQETGLRLHRHLLLGEPAHEVLRLARRVRADLVVAGSHGAGFFGRFLLGGTSSKLVHASAVTLLMSPPPSGQPRAELARDEVLAQLGAGGDLALYQEPLTPVRVGTGGRVDEEC
jgi:uncharacterized protein